MKPFVISQWEILDNLLKKINEESQLQEIPTLGVSHTILVRNQKSKEKAERELSEKYKCPVFTIFESKVLIFNGILNNSIKGLEFDDVILYNFFTDSELKDNTWNVLSLLDVCDETLSEKDFNFQFDRN